MARCLLSLVILLVCGGSAICRAGGLARLSACSGDGGLQLGLHGEYNVSVGEAWRLGLAGTLPQSLGDEAAYASLRLTWSGENWRWSGTGRVNWADTWHRGCLQIRGDYTRPEWSLSTILGEQDPDDPSEEMGLAVRFARRLSPRWRLSFYQGLMDVTTNLTRDHYRRYEAEAGATWRGTGRRYSLTVGGTSRRGEEPDGDARRLRAELAWHRRLKAGWSFDGELAMGREEEDLASVGGGALSLSLNRAAPVGLRLQARYDESGTVRSGFTVMGGGGALRWRAGLAGEMPPDAGGEAWAYAALTWRAERWETTLGLTPAGEYAVNSRQGYWLEVAYRF